MANIPIPIPPQKDQFQYTSSNYQFHIEITVRERAKIDILNEKNNNYFREALFNFPILRCINKYDICNILYFIYYL